MLKIEENLQEADNPLDVRLYEIDYVMSYPLGQGFEITDIHNIIRAIPDVTTVRTIGNAKRSQGNRTVSLQRLKFALQGQKNRTEWIKQILLPQIHKISSKIRIHKVDRAELISSSKQRLEESYYNSTMRQSPGRTTPLPSVQNLIDDWVEGGVMYDQPTNHNLTRYSVMMPVEDLKHLCGREARKHGHHFDAGYENFIQNGPRDPIYLAIGKNGRARLLEMKMICVTQLKQEWRKYQYSSLINAKFRRTNEENSPQHRSRNLWNNLWIVSRDVAFPTPPSHRAHIAIKLFQSTMT